MDSTSITVIKPGQLIDGLGGPPISGAAVVLQENLIHWIGSSEEIETNQEIKNLVDSAGQYGVLDLPQCTLLPGLIDCHSHTNMPGDGRTGEEVNADTDDVRLLRAARNTTLALHSGVTTLCDCGQNTRLGHNFCRVKDHRAHVFILHRLVAQMDQPFGRRKRTPLWRNNFKYVCHFLAPILEVLSDAFCSLQEYT